MVAAETHSRAVEDYLKAIYKLERVSSPAAPASTNALAEELDRSAASVSNMVKNLADQGLAWHEPYRGVRLTPAGRRAALRIIRRHRVIDTWDGVHAEAERLEHAASVDLVDRMARALGDPDTDPHGAPIPARDGSIHRRDLAALATLPAGGRGHVRQVSDDDGDRLRALSAMGISLDTEVEMMALLADGTCRVRVGGAEHRIEPELAADVLVEPAAPERANDGEADQGG